MSSKKSKILIIDDEAAILHALQIFLEGPGCDVEAATSYNDYLKDIDARDLPDLIILDMMLSAEDGRDVAKKIKSSPKTRHIPVVMISAQPAADKSARAAGADGFLAKPFDIEALRSMIKRLSSKMA